jgi:hypothetical protein
MRWRSVPVVLLALVALPAAAATFVVPSVEEMARSSDAVVRGRVVGATARTTPAGRIVTDVDVSVDGVWKGAPQRTVRLVVRGGDTGKLALRVDAAPTFTVGEDVVVFLSRGSGAWRVNGQALGKYRVEGAEARTALGGARTLPGALAAGERRVETMAIDELERRVRSTR